MSVGPRVVFVGFGFGIALWVLCLKAPEVRRVFGSAASAGRVNDAG